MKILVMNAGSSTHKAGLYEITGSAPPDEPIPPLWKAHVDWEEGEAGAELEVTTAAGAVLRETLPPGSRSAALARMLDTLWSGTTRVVDRPDDIHGVGQRVVHGGSRYQQSVPITGEVKTAIADLA